MPTLVADGQPVNHQWSKGEEFERGFAELIRDALGPGLVGVLLPAPAHGAVGRAALRPAHRLPPRVPQLQPRLPPGPGPAPRPLVRALRQVLLHRPRPRPVHGPRRTWPPSSPATSRWRTPPTRTASAPWSGWASTRSPSSAWATSTSAGPPCSWRRGGEDRAGTLLLRRLHDELTAVAPGAGVAPARAARTAWGPITSRSAMHPPISWSALADASVGVWGLGVEGRASIRRLRTMGCVPVLVDDAPALPTVDGLDVLATGSGGLDALLGCDVVVKSPGISRYRPEVARARGGGGDGLRRPGTVHGGGRSGPRRLHHRDQGQEHDDGPGRPPPHRPRLPRPRRREHRPSALGPLARARPRLLGDRDLELPGARHRRRAPCGRRDLPVTRSPRLARHGRALLRRQALAVHQAGRHARPRRRLRRAAPCACGAPRPAPALGHGRRGRA